ncbi:MAG: sigma 54-interacting transcriptional regulator, partial [Desulfosporosinus sp.]|nr:sigma 54-interacting transcriptional regulator [Desulfosporosinus sp.]
IRGESGTGKEMLARSIHNLSSRQQGMFMAINCTAIPEALLESELFGYEEGAFTGARKGGKIGKFELANKGTLFLDEIGDMPLFLQAKILRVLQERQIERIGGIVPIPVDVRVIAATHRNLEEMMTKGEFREDLYYRINVFPIDIKPLRDRKEDLQILCEHFIEGFNQRLNKNVKLISNGFRQKLMEYSWPGNVRELQNIIEYAMNLAKDSTLTEEHLSPRLKNIKTQNEEDEFNLEKVERETIKRCYQMFGAGVQGKEKAAKALGIGIATLYRKLARYNIE